MFNDAEEEEYHWPSLGLGIACKFGWKYIDMEWMKF